MSTRDEFADFTRSLLNDAAMADRRVGEAVLGAALIDQAFGSGVSAAAPLTEPTPSLDAVTQELAALIGERERELERRRAALSVFVARYMDAVSGVLDQFDQITIQLAQRLAPHDKPPPTPPTQPWSPTRPNTTTPIVEAQASPTAAPQPTASADATKPAAPAATPPADEVDLRADYRRLAKLIAPDLGQRDDAADQAWRTESLARLSAAYRHGDASAMAMVEVEVAARVGTDEFDDDHEALTERRQRLSRTCMALESRLERLDAELFALDASTMDQLRRHAERAEAAGENFLADHVAGMHDQAAQIQASLDELNGRGIRQSQRQRAV